MQCATIEFARSVCNIVGANSTEFDQELNEEQMVVIDMPEHGSHQQAKGGTMRLGRRTTVFLTDDSKLRSLYLSSNTLNEKNNSVDERHRHRYEINPTFVPRLSSDGLLFVGMGVDEFSQEVYPGIEEERRTRSSAALMRLAHVENTKSTLLQKITELCQRGGDGISKTAVRMEIVELQGHPYFVGVQFHPEYLSKPLKPSAPFLGFILAASGQLNSFLSGSRVPSPMTLLGDEQEEPSLGNKNMFQLGVNDVYGNGIGVPMKVNSSNTLNEKNNSMPMKVNGVNGNGIDHRIESNCC